MAPRGRKAGSAKAPAIPEALSRLPAQGKGPNKRTPQSAFDPAKDKDIYEPEAVVGTRKAKNKEGQQIDQYLVKWKDFDSRQNTWEPLEHLAGCEDMIVAYTEKQKQQRTELEADLEQRRAERQEAMAAERKKKAAALVASRAAAAASAKSTGTPAAPQPAENSAAATSNANDDGESGGAERTEAASSQEQPTKKLKKRSATCWQCFVENADLDGAVCILPHNKKEDSVCGEMISHKWGTSGMWNHLMYCHHAEYMRLVSHTPAQHSHSCLLIACLPPRLLCRLKPTTEKLIPLDNLPTVAMWPTARRDELHKAHALWLVRNKRAFNLAEDTEYRAIWRRALHGAYQPPDRKTLRGHVLMLAKEGLDYITQVNAGLRAEGLQVAAAGDIWSDRGVSLLGICQYHIDDKFKINELVRRPPPN